MMKTFKELLKEIEACSKARHMVRNMTVEEAVAKCHRGDWLLWLAAKIDIGLQPLSLAKGHCANTVRHLMKDDRSIKAVDMVITFGEGKVTIEELAAYATADAAAATTDAAYAAAYAVYTAYAATYAAYATAISTTANAATGTTAYAADIADTARKKNQLQTAEICKKYIGQLIIDRVNELLMEKRISKTKH